MADEVEIKAVHGGRLVEWSGQLCFAEADALRSPALGAAYEDGGRRSAIRGAEDDHRKAKSHVRREIRLAAKHLSWYCERKGIATVAELKPEVRRTFERFKREIGKYSHRRFGEFWIYNDLATVAEIERAIEQLDQRKFGTADELFEFFYVKCRGFRSSVRRYLPTKIH